MDFCSTECTSKSAMCGRGVIADDKSRLFTVCLGMEIIAVIFAENKNRMSGSGSIVTMGTANGV